MVVAGRPVMTARPLDPSTPASSSPCGRLAASGPRHPARTPARRSSRHPTTRPGEWSSRRVECRRRGAAHAVRTMPAVRTVLGPERPGTSHARHPCTRLPDPRPDHGGRGHGGHLAPPLAGGRRELGDHRPRARAGERSPRAAAGTVSVLRDGHPHRVVASTDRRRPCRRPLVPIPPTGTGSRGPLRRRCHQRSRLRGDAAVARVRAWSRRCAVRSPAPDPPGPPGRLDRRRRGRRGHHRARRRAAFAVVPRTEQIVRAG
jgi:hypothetical protein